MSLPDETRLFTGHDYMPGVGSRLMRSMLCQSARALPPGKSARAVPPFRSAVGRFQATPYGWGSTLISQSVPECSSDQLPGGR